MKVTVNGSLLSRLKKLKKMIRKGDEPKPFKRQCKSVDGIIQAMILEGVGKWEFIHDYPGRKRRRKEYKEKKKKLLKGKKKYATD